MRFIILFCLLVTSSPAVVQTPAAEYRVGLWSGASHQYPLRRPGAGKLAGHSHPVHEAYSIEVGRLTARGWYASIDAGFQEFDWTEGYEYSRLWRAGAMGGYRLWSVGGLNVLGKLGLGGGYYLATNYVDDAAYNTERARRDSLNNYAGYALRRDDSHRAQEVHFLLSAMVELCYRIGRHHTISATGGHQQGFRPFIDDHYTILSAGAARAPRESFRLRINGTALPFAVGYSYRFQRRESNSTKYREIPPGGGLRRSRKR